MKDGFYMSIGLTGIDYFVGRRDIESGSCVGENLKVFGEHLKLPSEEVFGMLVNGEVLTINQS